MRTWFRAREKNKHRLESELELRFFEGAMKHKTKVVVG